MGCIHSLATLIGRYKGCYALLEYLRLGAAIFRYLVVLKL